MTTGKSLALVKCVQLKNTKLHGVYEALTLPNKFDDRPCDQRQVRNIGQTVNVEQGKHHGKNVADDMQASLALVQMHHFVKDVCVRHGRSPMILAYTEEQALDMWRFCSKHTPMAMWSVVWVDRTFYLGPCYVTLSV